MSNNTNKMQVLYRNIQKAKVTSPQIDGGTAAITGWQHILGKDHFETTRILAEFSISVLELKDFTELEASLSNEDAHIDWVSEVLSALSTQGQFHPNMNRLTPNALAVLHSQSKNWAKQFQTKIKNDQKMLDSIRSRLFNEIDNIRNSNCSDDLKFFLISEINKLIYSLINLDEVGVENLKDRLLITVGNIGMNPAAKDYAENSTNFKEAVGDLANLITITGVTLPVLMAQVSQLFLM